MRKAEANASRKPTESSSHLVAGVAAHWGAGPTTPDRTPLSHRRRQAERAPPRGQRQVLSIASGGHSWSEVVAVDVYSVVTATKPLRQAMKVAAGWGGAWVGCKVVGAGGAWVGTAVTPGVGTAIEGVVGCIAGGFIGYQGASAGAGRLYDWGEATFVPVPEMAAP